jgi:phosphoglycolate phosphatase
MRIRCVLFDLDGTLVDSSDDIASSLDAALARHSLPALGVDRVMKFVGDGARTLVERALRATGAPLDDTDAVLESYLREYRARHLDRTRLYPGVADTLALLADREIACGVVTNKPYEFSVSLLSHLGVSSRFAVVIGGDSTPERKPSAGPLLAAAAACGAVVADMAMVGDGDADMRAGTAAGTYTVGVTYGFRSAEDLRASGAERLIDSIVELPDVLGLHEESAR